MSCNKKLSSKFFSLALVVSSFVLTENSFAARKVMEVVPLWNKNELIPTCSQQTGFGIAYKEEPTNFALESDGSNKLYLAFRVTNAPLSASCVADPMSCLSQLAILPIPRKRIVHLVADPLFSMPAFSKIDFFVVGVTTGNPDPVVYSPFASMNFTPCLDTAPMPQLIQNGAGAPLDLSPRGPTTNPFRGVKMPTKWMYPPRGFFGGNEASAKIRVGVVGYEPNIELVRLTVKNATGTLGFVDIPGYQTKIDKESGRRGFFAELDSALFPEGPLAVEATVIPKIGTPMVMAGAITSVAQRRSNEFGLSIFNNKLNQKPIRKRYVEMNGSSSLTCGLTVATACNTINNAMRAHKTQYGNSFEGLKILVGAGTFKFGIEAADYEWTSNTTPGQVPFIVEGKTDGIGRFLTTINERTDLAGAGMPSATIVGHGTDYVMYSKLKLQNNPNGPDPRGYLLGIGSSSPAAVLVAKDIDREGAGSSICAGDSDGFGTTFGHIVRYAAGNGIFNGNQLTYISSMIATFSIALSNPSLVLSVGVDVDHNAKRPPSVNGVMDVCAQTPSSSPHGDVGKSDSNSDYIYIDTVNTPIEMDQLTQGLYPAGDFNVFRNIFLKVGLAFIFNGPGRGYLGNGNTHTVIDSTTIQGGPKNAEAGSNATLIVANDPNGQSGYSASGSTTDPSGSGIPYNTNGHWISPASGIAYSTNLNPVASRN